MSGPFFSDELTAPPERYPHKPGHRRHDTSKAAAEAMTPSAAGLQDRVLATLRKKGPLTSFEASEVMKVAFEAVQPRFSELSALGLVEDSGDRGAARSPKRKAIRWRLTAKARAA